MSIPSLQKLRAAKKSKSRRSRALAALLLIAIVLPACSGDIMALLNPATPTPEVQPTPTLVLATPSPAAQITFRVEIPANTPPDQPVYLSVMEEVNGLAISARHHAMQIEDENHYALTLPFTLGSAVKYRYSRQGEAAALEEHISDGRQVRYRIYHVTGPGQVEDVVSRWTDTQFEGATGRISGQALDAATGQPIPNLLAAAGGVQTLTSSEGTFLIEGLLPGVHNLVLYALDGSYRTYQQGALIAAESTTPAQVQLASAPLVSLVFVLSVPAGTIPAVPIRIAGNLHQLGNTYANLSGGVSTIASRMPSLNILPDGRYTLTLSLPAGSDLRYIYTLGDGLWNTERAAANPYPLRQIIIPDVSAQVTDEVESWATQDSAPITFEVTVPENTPEEDTVSIQFNPIYGWTEPLPMWRLGSNHWGYILNNPPGQISELHYRFCRNDQCSAADDSRTMGASSPGFTVSPAQDPQTIVDTVEQWAWLDESAGEAEVNVQPIAVRGQSFMAGIELQPAYHPSWMARVPNLFNDIHGMGANWIVLTPSWTYTRSAPPVLEPVAGRDPLWADLTAILERSAENGVSAAVFPTPGFLLKTDEWWASAPRDFSWWLVWFDRYRNFILHNADLAERSGAQALILGGDWLAPALPGGVLPDGTPSGVPADAEGRWRTLLQEVRDRYSGSLIWAIPYSQAASAPPSFLDSVDQIYVLFSERLSDLADPSQEALQAEVSRLLDEGLLPLQTGFGKPILLAAAYPSADGANAACLPDPNGGCLAFDALAQPNPDIPGIQPDLQEQADIYNAFFVAVNQRTWISGFIPRGFYPPAILRDKSTSVHGKPAQDVIAYWFPRLLGNMSP